MVWWRGEAQLWRCKGAVGVFRVVCCMWCRVQGVCVGVMRVFGSWGYHGALMVLMLVSRSGWAAVECVGSGKDHCNGTGEVDINKRSRLKS